MTIRDGVQVIEVTVESIEPGNRALTIDGYGRKRTLRTDVRRGNGPPPRKGERWLIDQTLGSWTFAACLIAKPPVISGDARGVAMQTLLATLADAGLIVDETTAAGSGTEGGGLPDGAQDGEYLQWNDGDADWVPGDPHQVFAEDPTHPGALIVGLSALGPHSVPTGAFFPYLGPSAPVGYLLCQGQAISRTTYADLFALLGTAHGVGDGSTTFNLPDLRSRVPVGLDTRDPATNVIGETGGAKVHALTIAEMPNHTHGQSPHSHPQNVSANDVGGTGVRQDWDGDFPGLGTYPQGINTAAVTAVNLTTGGGAPHNNMQPYLIANYIVKV